MDDPETGIADWVVPTVLIALGVGVILSAGLVVAATEENRSEAPSLIRSLDIYTECLDDNGADVPRVEIRRDGGFSVTVPASLVQGGVDESTWQQAADQCADVAPQNLGGLLGEFWGGWFEAVPAAVFNHAPATDEFTDVGELEVIECDAAHEQRRPMLPRPGKRNLRPEDLERRCARLDDFEDNASGPRIGRLRRQCEQPDR